jgi:hypothetical protein
MKKRRFVKKAMVNGDIKAPVGMRVKESVESGGLHLHKLPDGFVCFNAKDGALLFQQVLTGHGLPTLFFPDELGSVEKNKKSCTANEPLLNSDHPQRLFPLNSLPPDNRERLSCVSRRGVLPFSELCFGSPLMRPLWTHSPAGLLI